MNERILNLMTNIQKFDVQICVCVGSTKGYQRLSKEALRELIFMQFGRKLHFFDFIINIFYVVGKTTRQLGRQEDNYINFMQFGRILHFFSFCMNSQEVI